jgi:hypothetical protein
MKPAVFPFTSALMLTIGVMIAMATKFFILLSIGLNIYLLKDIMNPSIVFKSLPFLVRTIFKLRSYLNRTSISLYVNSGTFKRYLALTIFIYAFVSKINTFEGVKGPSHGVLAWRP